ncbi:MAG TPA: SDR family oxidoreductase [Gemmatimonadales bacterium]|nr:SDR family oxidoreductase [Gemmatimonadales bacterium]
MTRELRDRVALVTGGARRLGRAFTLALASRGMRLAVHYGSSANEARDVVAELREQGIDADAFGADLRDPAEARALPGRVVERFGRLDVLVNSAAVMERIPIEEVTVDAWESQVGLNLRAPFFLAQQAAPHLRAHHGTIVNIADLSGFEPWRNYPVHSISKAGVVMLTKVLASALAPEITVNGIAPGTVLLPEDYDDARRAFLAETTPLQRLGAPEDAVAALLYLVEHGTFVTGETIVVDGGRLLRR